MAELPLTDWSLTQEAIELVCAEIAARQAPAVVELGAGASTVPFR